MKKLVILCVAVILGIGVCLSISVQTNAANMESPQKYSARDIQNLLDYLLTKPTETDYTDLSYDLNDDGIWNASDLAHMLQNTNQEEADEMKINLAVNGSVLTATLADNAAAQALAELLKDAPMELHLNEYGSFEKVGALPQSLPKNDERITTEPGDIMLYQGNQITIFYGANTWSYTRLGKIDNATQTELKSIFGDGNVTVTLSLAN